jgi:hypothetical protein
MLMAARQADALVYEAECWELLDDGATLTEVRRHLEGEGLTDFEIDELLALIEQPYWSARVTLGGTAHLEAPEAAPSAGTNSPDWARPAVWMLVIFALAWLLTAVGRDSLDRRDLGAGLHRGVGLRSRA